MSTTSPPLNDLYSDATLSNLRGLSLTSFHTLVHQASLTQDFEFAVRALPLAGADPMTTSKASDSLSYTDGTGSLVAFTNEALYKSFLRQLSYRPFGPAEQQYLESALALSMAVDRRKFATNQDATPEQHTATAYFTQAATERAPAEVLQHLIGKNVDPFLCKPCNVKINGTYVAVSPLAAAVLVDAPDVFSSLITKAAQADCVTVEKGFTKTHLKENRSGPPEETRGLLQTIALYSSRENLGAYLDEIARIVPITDALIDGMLTHFFKHDSRGKKGDRIELRNRWQRQISSSTRDDDVVALLLSRRRDTAMPPELVRLAVESACTPVISAAAQSPDFDIHSAYSATTTYWTTPIHSLTHGAFPDEQLRTALGLVLAHGADINALNSQGETALILAACNAKMDVISALLDAGADPEIKDKRNWRAVSHLKKAEDKRRFEQMVSSLKAKKKIATIVESARGAKPS